MDETTRMCRIKAKDWENRKDDIRDRVRDARFVCAKCFRSAADKRHLCKPKKIR